MWIYMIGVGVVGIDVGFIKSIVRNRVYVYFIIGEWFRIGFYVWRKLGFWVYGYGIRFEMISCGMELVRGNGVSYLVRS